MYRAGCVRVPPHAAVAATAEACRRLKKPWAVPLVNAVLRRFLATREASIESTSPESARFAHPEWLLCAFRTAWPSDWEAIATANNQPPPMAIRVNSRRAGRDAYLVELRDAGIPASPAPHADQGLVLASPMEATALPGFRMGAVSVQDTAAQLAAPLLDVRAGHYVLDACAAPGGKAAHLLEISPAARLVAVDKDPGRLMNVSITLERLGLQARVMTGDAADPSTFWDGHLFDRMLLDAPCSGTGVIRRHPDIKVLRRPSDIARMAEEQSRMLAGLWPILAPGVSSCMPPAPSFPRKTRIASMPFWVYTRTPGSCLSRQPGAAIPAPAGRSFRARTGWTGSSMPCSRRPKAPSPRRRPAERRGHVLRADRWRNTRMRQRETINHRHLYPLLLRKRVDVLFLFRMGRRFQTKLLDPNLQDQVVRTKHSTVHRRRRSATL